MKQKIGKKKDNVFFGMSVGCFLLKTVSSR